MKRIILLSILCAVFCTQTMKGQEMYTEFKDNTLTFYYDNLKSSRTGKVYNMIFHVEEDVGWYKDGNNLKITKAVFDASFANARPTSTSLWFYSLKKMETITNIGYLNTENVKSMDYMFQGCNSLKSIDLSKFNTANVLNMKSMFSSCNSLTTLNLSHLNTSRVSDMSYLLSGCENLTTLDITHLNTDNVENMMYMFMDCSSLKTIDLSKLNTEKVTTMRGMFDGCSSLTSIDVGGFKTSNVTDIDGMFYKCGNLKKIDLTSFDTRNVKHMGSLFEKCTNLTDVNIGHFITPNLSTMHYMFLDCSSLTTIDLSSFNTSQVEYMYNMFSRCSNLKTIYVGKGWSMQKVVNSTRMFENCTSLVGGKGTKYSSSHTDGAYAHVDEGTANPGYFTAPTYYGFSIVGIDVTNLNKDNILGDGKAKYNSDTYTLTLNNVKVEEEEGLENDGNYSLKIVVIGDNEIKATDYNAFSSSFSVSTTISGSGTLCLTATRNKWHGVYKNDSYMTIDGATVICKGDGYGFFDDGGALYMKNNGTLMAYGNQFPSVELPAAKDMHLDSNIAIRYPVGAYIQGFNVYYAGTFTNVQRDWVVIGPPGVVPPRNPYDLNNDGKVSTADIQVIINEMKKPAASQNMSYDLNNDGKISTADIQVIINEMKK